MVRSPRLVSARGRLMGHVVPYQTASSSHASPAQPPSRPLGRCSIRNLLPKEFVFENAVAELEDDQIDELILKLRQRVIEARAAPPTLLASPAEVNNESE